MQLKANAKINLCLDVIRRRADGYHDLDMVMVPLQLADTIALTIAEHDCISSNDSTMPLDMSNTMMKAIYYMREAFHFTEHFQIHVEKRIPMEAGLAGGSSDGAAVIRGINEMLALHQPMEKLLKIGKKVGADVPFCIMNQSSRVKGIGEIVDPFCIHCDFDILLVKPSIGVSTGKAYQTLDFHTCHHPNCDDVVQALQTNDFSKLCNAIGNTLESSAFVLAPEVEQVKQACIQAGFEGVLMSGSGSTVFAITRNQSLLKREAERFKQKYPFVCITKIQ